MADEEYRRTFSKNLKYYMHIKNKTQADLISDLGLSSSTVSNWCTGLKLPRMDKVQLLADYFGILKADLIESKENKTLSTNRPIQLPVLDCVATSIPIPATDYSMNFSQIVKQLRTERGWSQQDLAERVGLNKMTISQYENGKRKPSFDAIEALAKVFHVDMNHLFGFTDKIQQLPGNEIDPAVNKYFCVSIGEIDLIEAYRHAGEETKAAIRAILHIQSGVTLV